MHETYDVQRLAAFTAEGVGGNPAGVVISDALPAEDRMQRVAADVGFSETAFLEPAGERRWRIRYFSPEREVEFCGHATIATGVALAERFGEGEFVLETNGGVVPVSTQIEDGQALATLTSLEPASKPIEPAVLLDALRHLGWDARDLDQSVPAALAFAGAWHLVIAAKSHDRLRRLDYDFDGLKELMLRQGMTTVQLIWRESDAVIHSRNPFPVGGVVEDPATGAAAAALGAYLRSLGLATPGQRITIFQGVDMGKPSRLLVDLFEDDARVRVTGAAARIPAAEAS